MHRYRTHTCGQLRASDVGAEIRLSGWVHRVRDHGGVLFIDLRDHYGLTQVVVDPDSPAFKSAEIVRAEWVIRIDGTVRRRPEGTENPDLSTGAIEVGALVPLPPGPASTDLVAQYSADVDQWARAVPVTAPVRFTVVLAPLGDAWRVIAVSD